MARPLKDGVDYFPKDTDFYINNDKIKLLRARFGAKGMYLLDYILCDLYGKNGYYMQWDKNKCYLVSDGAGCGCSPEFVAEFITGSLQYGFFNETVFSQFGVLTSAGIQRRFVRMLKSRESFTFIKEYFLLDTSDPNDVPKGILDKLIFKTVSNKENGVFGAENPDKTPDNSQSKIEENKIKESKADSVSAAIFKIYEENIGCVSSIVAEQIMDWLNDVDASLIEYAIIEAVTNNKRSLKYIKAIIENHFKAGRKTRADAEAARPQKQGDKFDKFKQPDVDTMSIEAVAIRKRMEAQGIHAG